MKDVSVSKEPQFNLEYYAEIKQNLSKQIQNYRPEQHQRGEGLRGNFDNLRL